MILKRWRLVVWWLLTLALPVQGHAAATMRWCHGGAHQMAMASAAAHHEPTVPLRQVGGHGAGHEGHHAAVMQGTTADDDAVMSAQAREGSQVTSSDAGGGCSACAACCVVAVPATPVLQVPEPLACHAYVAWTAGPCPGFLTAAPERPPRPTRA